MASAVPQFQPMNVEDCLLVLDELDEVMSGARTLLDRARDYELDALLPDDFVALEELYGRMLAEQRHYTRLLITLSRNADDAAGCGRSGCGSRAPASPAAAAAGASET